MFATYEFEVYPGERYYIAEPVGLEGGTQGETLEEAVEMAADWLRGEVEFRAVRGLDMPRPEFRDAPAHPGGMLCLVGVDAGRETVERVSSTEAARMLGVTPARVSQMIKAHRLEGWRDGRNTYVTLDSVRARLQDGVKVGRPRKIVTA